MSYAERKEKYDSKTGIPVRSVSNEHRRLWDAINKFVHLQGGAITTQPHRWPHRLETRTNSSLSAKLQEFGYSLHCVGRTSRITIDGFVQADVIKIDVPK